MILFSQNRSSQAAHPRAELRSGKHHMQCKTNSKVKLSKIIFLIPNLTDETTLEKTLQHRTAFQCPSHTGIFPQERGMRQTSLLLCQTQGGDLLGILWPKWDRSRSGDHNPSYPTRCLRALSNPRHWSKVCSDFCNFGLISKDIPLHIHRDGYEGRCLHLFFFLLVFK